MLNPRPPLEIDKILAPRSSRDFLGYAIVGVLISLLSGGNPIGLIGLVTIFIAWWWRDYRQLQQLKQLRLQLEVQVKKAAPVPAKGLILLLSPYSPKNPALKNSEIIESLLDEPKRRGY